MRRTMWAVFMVLAVMLTTTSVAPVAETRPAVEPKKPQYKRVTGKVVSVSATGIVIRSRVKGDMTIGITKKTNMVHGKAPKQGDRARVNYRIDRSGKTATRIEVLASSPKPQTQPVRSISR